VEVLLEAGLSAQEIDALADKGAEVAPNRTPLDRPENANP
jgi:hypothetical protein